MELNSNDPFVAQARAAGVADSDIAAYMSADQQRQQSEQQAAASIPANQSVSENNGAEQATSNVPATVILGNTGAGNLLGTAADYGAKAAELYGVYKVGQTANALMDKFKNSSIPSASNLPGSPTNPIGGTSPITPATGSATATPSSTARTIPIRNLNAPAAPTVAPAAPSMPQTAPAATPTQPASNWTADLLAQNRAQAQRVAAQTAQAQMAPYSPYTPPAAAAPVEQPGLMNRFGQLASQYANALAESPVGKVAGTVLNNPVTRALSSPVGVGAQLAAYPTALNANEQQGLGQAQQWQNAFSHLPAQLQSNYYSLPADKQIQVNAMIMRGQDPTAVLSAVNTQAVKKIHQVR